MIHHRTRNVFVNMVLVFLVSYWVVPVLLQTVAGNHADVSGAAVVQAADAGGGGAAAGETQRPRRTLLKVVLWDSGIWEWVLILLSIAGFALCIQTFVDQRPEKLLPPHFEEDMAQLFEEEQFEEALDVCEDDDTVIARIVAAGLTRMDSGYDSMMEAIEEVGDQEATLIFQKLSYIALVAAIGPMLGLLGTIVGMITAFNRIVDTGGTASPADLAGGISTALITTATGLIIAIPTTIIHAFYKNRATRIIMDANIIVHELFDRLRNK